MPQQSKTPLARAAAAAAARKAAAPAPPADAGLGKLIPDFIQNLASPFYGGDVESEPRPSTPRRALGPKDMVVGAQAEYYSDTHRCWIMCQVTFVDPETGGLKIDVKPNQTLDLVEQRMKLRTRTRPRRDQLEWVRSVLHEGRLEAEAQAIFRRYASGGFRTESAMTSLGMDSLGGIGADLDELLGVSGCVCTLRKAAAVSSDQRLTLEAFSEVFWELLWWVQRDFGQALVTEAATQRHQRKVQEAYTFERTLGMGTFGTVKLARSKANRSQRAIKLVSKKDHYAGSVEQLKVEVEHLVSLDHPHIVRLYEHFEDATHIYLVMDYCSGGELFQVVREYRESYRSRIPEVFIAHVMRQVMLAIAHVHARGIVHLDLKSTNIMLMPSRSTLPPGEEDQGGTVARVGEKPHVMVIDLGVAQIFRPGNFKFNRPMGTPATMAPEVWTGEVHPKADVFSCGVVLFEMLSLTFPFNCQADHALAIRYWSTQPSPPWHLLLTPSQHGPELCRRMIELSRHDRPTASACLQDAFLRESGAAASHKEQPTAPKHLVRQLAEASKRSVLHRSVALSLARQWPSNQLPSIKRLFHELDTQRHGRLEVDCLELALQRLGIDKTCAKESAEAMDLNRDGTVCWTEFVAACIDLGSSTCERALRGAFDQADSDGDGLLSQKDLCRLLALEHLCDGQTARDVFTELAGRQDPGARIDWPTFRKHFGAGESNHEAASATPSRCQNGAADFLSQARDFVERARDSFFPQSQPAPSEPSKEDLKQLAQMGFTDKERCLAVLKKHGNKLDLFVVNELVEGPPEIESRRHANI